MPHHSTTSQVVLVSHRHDRVHLAPHPGIMHRHNNFGFLGNHGFQQGFIHIQCVRPDVNEPDFCPPQGKGIGCGYKGERRHDNLIPGLDIAENSRHFQGPGTGMGEHCFVNAELCFHQVTALGGKPAVTGQVAEFHSLGNVIQFFSGDVGPVEGDENIHSERTF